MRPVFLLCLVAAAAHAEPSATVEWLMDEPVTLWDWGMYKLNERLTQEIGVWDELWTPSVAYDQETNTIVVHLRHAVAIPTALPSEAKAECRLAVLFVREILASTEGESKESVVGPLGELFCHIGCESDEECKRIDTELKLMTKILATVPKVAKRTDGYGGTVACEAPLLDTDLSFRE